MSNKFSKSFETTRKKIRQNFEESTFQKNDIIDQESINSDIDDEIKNSLPNLWVNSRSRSFTTAWENPDIVTTNENGVSGLIKTWEVDLGILPEDLIPYIRVDFRVRNGGGGLAIGSDFEFGGGLVVFNKYFQVIDLQPATSFFNLPEFILFDTEDDPNDELNQVKVLASLAVTDNDGNLEPYQVSLSVYLQNPRDFI